jgi:predicted ester cyclase
MKVETVTAAEHANKQVVRRFVEEYQEGQSVAAFEQLLSQRFVDHSLLPGFPEGPEGVRALFSALHAALPDFRAEIYDQVAEGDKVVTRKAFFGTQRGELFGAAPTGRQIRIDVIDIVRVRDGQIVEHWNLVDQLGLFRQLGLIPEA